MTSSIIIRVKNEEQHLRKLFPILKSQTNQDFEIVIVDNSSIDKSANLVFDYFPKERIKIVRIEALNFTYPKASNLGAFNSNGKYLVYISSHSYPISNTWLEDGLSNFTEEVAGVFAYPIANKDTKFFEKYAYNLFANIFHSKKKVYRSLKIGMLGNTNAIIRKDLWEQYHINEYYEKGYEDVEWAWHFIKRGYSVIQDPRFRVHHSHYMSLGKLIKQEYLWYKMHQNMIKHSKIE